MRAALVDIDMGFKSPNWSQPHELSKGQLISKANFKVVI